MRFLGWFATGIVLTLGMVFVLVSEGGALLPTNVAYMQLNPPAPTGSSGVTPTMTSGNSVFKGTHTRIGPVVIVWP